MQSFSVVWLIAYCFHAVVSYYHKETRWLPQVAYKLRPLSDYTIVRDSEPPKQSSPTVIVDFFKKISQPSNEETVDSLIFADIHELGRQVAKTVRTPHTKDEAWRFTNINRLFSTCYHQKRSTEEITAMKSKVATIMQQYCHESCKDSAIVFLDGVYQPSLSKISAIQESGLNMVSLSQGDKCPTALWDLLQWVPNNGASSRESYGSDALTAVNLVRGMPIKKPLIANLLITPVYL